MRHHHVNLSVPPGMLDEQRSFLVDVLGYASVEPPQALVDRGIGVNWFEGSDGAQIHLSEDPEHRPSMRAHTAVEFDASDFDAVQQRLEATGRDFRSIDASPGLPRVLFLADPAGNLWELRAPL